MSAPPDLRVLCRKLSSTPPDELTHLCPLLVSHVLRCGAPLSATQEAKGKDKSSETPVLIHKLRTSITTLLNGRNSSGRFAAICLIKAIIDVGGWECLRTAGAWITGLISVLQKPEPFASKQLSIVTLTRIYSLLHGYQTLVREMTTPTLPSYVNACIQIIKASTSGRGIEPPVSLVESVVRSLSKIVTLYPTTLRPSAAPIKAAIKIYMAPTWSDQLVVPQGLRQASRHLSVLLHYTAAKDGSSQEWARAIGATIKDCHITADQVFRAVHESWESSTGHKAEAVSTEGEPSGGGDSTDDLPPWTGVPAGSERLVGIIELLGEYLKSPTKAAVTLPIGQLLDLTSRLTLVTIPGNSEDHMNLNVAIGKDEKAELWSSLPDIHAAAMRLHIAMIDRLKENALSLSTDLIDQMVRVFNSSRQLTAIRETTYKLAKDILSISGPSLPKLTVKSLVLVIQSCCQDILRTAGHLEDKAPQPVTTTNGTKQKQQQKPSSTNADDYLTNSPTSSTTLSPFSPSHKAAAAELLPLFLSHLPQKHLSPDSRGLVDRTAILSRNKAAMLASCLQPYKDSRGRYYPSILPFLVRQFPRDQEVEVLRTNLLRAGRYVLASADDGLVDPREGLDELLKEPAEEDDDADEMMLSSNNNDVSGNAEPSAGDVDMEIDSTTAPAPKASTNAFFVSSTTQQTDELATGGSFVAPMKRKAETDATETGKKKRVDVREEVQEVQIALMPKAPEPQVAVDSKEQKRDNDSDSDSDGSVEIDMTMEDDEDEEDEDEEDDDEDE